ncbi:MAG: hypothetical protein Q8O59_03625 [bacterium]|nr:hypothetical protein [bacterium]
MEKASRDFFNIGKDTAVFAVDEAAEPYFNEWLIFDFKLANGKTLLENFYERNPYNLSPIDRQTYKDLMANEYGAFEVLAVDQGLGLELLSLQTAKKYYVHEFSATFQLKPGMVFFNRVAKVGDHYELVGSDSIRFDVRLGQGARNYLLKCQDKITPRDAFRLATEPAEKPRPRHGTEELNGKQIKKQLDLILSKINLANHVSADKIESWISRLDYEKEEVPAQTAIAMLFGFLPEEKNKQDVSRLTELVIQLANSTPQKALGGKSPKELMSAEGYKPKYRLDVTALNTGNYYKHYEKAMAAMKKHDSKKALKEYDACFNILLQERTTAPEIYRIFANTAIMNFSEGNEYEGLKLLDIALTLNPNYDFGINAIKKYEDGLYNNDIIAGRLYNILKRKNKAANEKRFKNNPANLYYQYLKKFKINFKTDTLTKSTITEVGPDSQVRIIEPREAPLINNKIGRNQPCPCGAKKPNGTPIKYKHCCGV